MESILNEFKKIENMSKEELTMYTKRLLGYCVDFLEAGKINSIINKLEIVNEEEKENYKTLIQNNDVCKPKITKELFIQQIPIDENGKFLIDIDMATLLHNNLKKAISENKMFFGLMKIKKYLIRPSSIIIQKVPLNKKGNPLIDIFTIEKFYKVLKESIENNERTVVVTTPLEIEIF